MFCVRRQMVRILRCSLGCIFSFEGFCQAHSRRVWEDAFDTSVGMWGTEEEPEEEPEAPIPRDCPVYQGQEVPLWRR